MKRLPSMLVGALQRGWSNASAASCTAARCNASGDNTTEKEQPVARKMGLGGGADATNLWGGVTENTDPNVLPEGGKFVHAIDTAVGSAGSYFSDQPYDPAQIAKPKGKRTFGTPIMSPYERSAMTLKYKIVPTLEDPDFQDQGTEKAVIPEPIVNPTIIDVDEALEEKLMSENKPRFAAPSVLSAEERESLARIIYVTNYRPGRDYIDRAEMLAASSEVRWMEEHFLLLYQGDIERTVQAVRKGVLERSDLHKPLSYIIGSQPFCSCDIVVRQPLLCPRPETEWWAMELVSQLRSANAADRPLRILDVCSGTGCIGVALAKMLPQATVVGLDLSKDAVLVSNINATRNGVDSRYICIHSDMFEALLPASSGAAAGSAAPTTDGLLRAFGVKDVAGKLRALTPASGWPQSFDLIVSNPPYILPKQFEELPNSVKLWESREALIGDKKREHMQSLYYREIIEAVPRLLKPRLQACDVPWPSVVMEVGLQAEAIATVLDRYPGWSNVTLAMDFADQPRIVTGVYNEAKLQERRNATVKTASAKRGGGIFSSFLGRK